MRLRRLQNLGIIVSKNMTMSEKHCIMSKPGHSIHYDSVISTYVFNKTNLFPLHASQFNAGHWNPNGSFRNSIFNINYSNGERKPTF